MAAAQSTVIRQDIIMYLNRLSDLLFTLARRANHEAKTADVPWRGVPTLMSTGSDPGG